MRRFIGKMLFRLGKLFYPDVYQYAFKNDYQKIMRIGYATGRASVEYNAREHARKTSMIYRAKLKSKAGFKALYDFLLSSQANKCFVCGRAHTQVDPLEVDHVIPVSRGGSNRPQNLVLMCRECNQLKGMLTLREFIAAITGTPLEKEEYEEA